MIGPIPYIGGKNRLAKEIISLIPPHTTYVEPFCGGAQVFFHKEPSAVEVLNDLDREIVNFLRVCQWHHEELLRLLRYLVVSREWYRIFSITDPATLTDIQRAARFFYLQKNSFGGLIVNQAYHFGIVQRPNFNPERIPEQIKLAHERLQRVQLECSPYEAVLARYDRPETFFYLDPPYYRRKLYKHNLSKADFEEMANRLSRLKGKFILSLNDHADVTSVFARFTIRPTSLSYSSQRRSGIRFGEVYISNLPALGRSQEKPALS